MLEMLLDRLPLELIWKIEDIIENDRMKKVFDKAAKHLSENFIRIAIRTNLDGIYYHFAEDEFIYDYPCARYDFKTSSKHIVRYITYEPLSSSNGVTELIYIGQIMPNLKRVEDKKCSNGLYVNSAGCNLASFINHSCEISNEKVIWGSSTSDTLILYDH